MDELITAPAPAKKGVGIGVLIGVAVMAVAISSGVAFFLVQRMAPAASPGVEPEEAVEEAEELADPIFYSLEPAFIVNLADLDVMRYLQIEMQVLSRKQETIDQLVKMMPVVRNQLLLLFGSKHYADLSGRQGKEMLQAEALLHVEAVLTGTPVAELAAASEAGKSKTGKKAKAGKAAKSSGIEAIYFTSFVMQ